MDEVQETELASLVHNMVSNEVTDTEDIPKQAPITLNKLEELEGDN